MSWNVSQNKKAHKRKKNMCSRATNALIENAHAGAQFIFIEILLPHMIRVGAKDFKKNCSHKTTCKN